MLDPRILKENPEAIREMLKKRNMADFPIDDLITLHNLESEAIQTEENFDQLMMTLPNLLNEGVPIGRDERHNVVVREYGNIITPNFKPKDHIDLANTLDLVDLSRAAKVSGARFYF